MNPKKIGHYKIKSELGRGGMATVYLGYDARLERDVAVKVLPREFLHDPTFKARFQREAKTIAGLEHPAIVPVYDFGEEDGQLYLVMRHMQGGSLADRLEKGKLSLDDVVEIFSRIGPALDKAHAKKIIHRDIKPGNILFDDQDRAYLADFGIAKISQDTGKLTGNAVIGTPAYISPEQARGEDLDGRTDLYALGVILVEALTGVLPYDGDTPLSIVLKHLQEPIPDVRTINPDLPAGIQAVVDKAMAKDADDRFASAKELRTALQAVEDGNTKIATEVINARVEETAAIRDKTEKLPYGEDLLPEKLRDGRDEKKKGKWLWGVLAGGILLVVGVVIVVAALAIFGDQPVTILAATSEAVSTELPNDLLEDDDATLHITSSPTTFLTAEVTTPPDVLAITLDNVLQVRELNKLSGHSDRVFIVAWSPDGSMLASGSSDSTVRIWNAVNGNNLKVLSGHSNTIRGIAWSPDGSKLASGSVDNTIRLWDVSRGDQLTILQGHSGFVVGVAWSPDGRTLASGSWDDTVRLWDAETGQQLLVLEGHKFGIDSVAWSPDGSVLASSSEDDTVQLWDAISGQKLFLLEGHIFGINIVAWSPDGSMLATASSDKTIGLWDAVSGNPLALLRGHTVHVLSVSWSPDGRMIASSSTDGTVRIWDVVSREQLMVLLGHTDRIHGVAWSPDGSLLATASWDGTVRLWGIPSE